MNALISAQDLTVIRNAHTVLQNVSITVGQNDFTTIIGPNGAGKSMLLKCLLGFYTPDHGHVLRKKNLRVGYVPQRLIPDFSLPITTKIFLTLRRKVHSTLLGNIIAETGIESLLSTPLHALSGGQLQRILLARSLLNDPELLVLDEPAQNLDLSGQMQFYKLLERIYAERHLSILMVSHDIHMVMASTKQVLCLFHKVCCVGEPQAITQHPEFITLFGADMAHMMAVYHHHHHKCRENNDD
jgi:zinc transport system ATP-binding protein